jgi:hypothetical protein
LSRTAKAGHGDYWCCNKLKYDSVFHMVPQENSYTAQKITTLL